MILTETMSIGEKFLSTLAITILGMVVVYIVLIIIAYSLELLRLLFSEKTKKEVAVKAIEIKKDDIKETVVKGNDENIELIVLITAAVAAFESTSSENIIVRSIREMPQNRSVWAAAGRQQQMFANNINRIRRP